MMGGQVVGVVGVFGFVHIDRGKAVQQQEVDRQPDRRRPERQAPRGRAERHGRSPKAVQAPAVSINTSRTLGCRPLTNPWWYSSVQAYSIDRTSDQAKIFFQDQNVEPINARANSRASTA